MKSVLLYKLLIIFYLSIHVILSSKVSPLEEIKKVKKEITKEEQLIREILSQLQEHIPGSQGIPAPLLDIIADYNKEIAWKTTRLKFSEVKGIEFKEDKDHAYVDWDLNFSGTLLRNGRSISYDKESKDLIIEEEAKCSSNPTGNIREKRLQFAIVEYENIKIFLGNRYLVIHGRFIKGNDGYYKSLDIYDLNKPEFWNTEFKANSDGKTILSRDESYGTHIESNSLCSTYEIGMWRDGEKEYVIIFLRQDDTGFEKFIDKKLKGNRKDPDKNLVIGGTENIILLDIKSIKRITTLYGIGSSTKNEHIIKIRGKTERWEWINVYYKIIRKEEWISE